MLIKLDVAAERLTVSRRTLDRLIAAGKLPVVRVSPDRYAIQEDAVERYIEENTVVHAVPSRLRMRPQVRLPDDDAERRLMELLTNRKKKPIQKR
jgi:excisionase family DNA binding protein